MFLVLKSFFLGVVISLVFKLFKLPVPAPDTWAGVAGVVGVTAGMYIFKLFSRLFS